MTTNPTDEKPVFLDPMNDCPDKLMWALCGYLAWVDDASAYETALIEVKTLIDITLENINSRRREATENTDDQ